MQGQVPEHGLSPAAAGQRQDTVRHFVCNVMPRLTDASRRSKQPRRLGGGQAQGRSRDARAHPRAAGSQLALRPRHGAAVEPVTTRAGLKSNTASKYDGDGGGLRAPAEIPRRMANWSAICVTSTARTSSREARSCRSDSSGETAAEEGVHHSSMPSYAPVSSPSVQPRRRSTRRRSTRGCYV